MERRFNFNPRAIGDLFAQYPNTFNAFCELINNSLQANSKNIEILIDQARQDEITPTLIKKIIIKDDGHGVCESDFNDRILNIGTDAKNGGKGIGRFAALQIGATANIETIAYDPPKKAFTKTSLSISESLFRSSKDVSQISFNSSDEVLSNSNGTYYQVTITDLYDSQISEIDRKKKLDENLLVGKIQDALFTRYPIKIFNREVLFSVNDKNLNPEDYVIGVPEKIRLSFCDKRGNTHEIFFSYFKVKLPTENIKVFLTVKNAGINTIAASFEFDAYWISPLMGSWFVYIDSDLFSTDMLRNFDWGDLDEEGRHVRNFIKESLNQFFRDKNKQFDDFTDRLKSDIHYPYNKGESVTNSKILVFDKLAYLVEEKYHILNEKNDLREIIYPLIDRSISNLSFKNILTNILKLDKKLVERFDNLLEEARLEDIIDFSERVSKKIQELDFLEQILYSDVSKFVSERKQLHKVLEKLLWIFGEKYYDSTKLLSDKNLENNLLSLRDEFLKYTPTKDKENWIEIKEKKIKSITDLFLYSEKIIDEETREILVVELKAPKVKISKKELQQVKDYAFTIEQRGVFPKGLLYKVILVGCDFTLQTEKELKGTSSGKNNPYFYYENESKNIQVQVIRWSDLLENNKRRLTYMANSLRVKDVDVKEKFEKEFSEINIEKISSRLTKSEILN
jgi:hypothetical protein